MGKYAIILAGGEGRRAGGEIPKQFQDLMGKPMLWWSMKAFKSACPDTHIILVLHPGFFDDWDIMFSELPDSDKVEHTVCCGGRSRTESVSYGLQMIEDLLNEKSVSAGDSPMVAIHDGARPIVSAEMIRRGFKAMEGAPAMVGVVPGVKCTNSMRMYVGDEDVKAIGSVNRKPTVAVDRNDFVAVQTPQIFRFDEIFSAYDFVERELAENSAWTGKEFTDDASLAEEYGMAIWLYEGEYSNIKVTNPEDFDIAKTLLENMENLENSESLENRENLENL